MAMIPSKI